MELIATVLTPIIVSFVSVYVALKLLPFDIQNKRSDTISKLYGTVDKLVDDLAEAKVTISSQAKKIEQLENRQEVTLRAQLHIRLTTPPTIESTVVEYILDDKILKVT
jgi:hypothetical protein